MLEELDRMHEECATLHEDAKVGFTAACQLQCLNLLVGLPTDNPKDASVPAWLGIALSY